MATRSTWESAGFCQGICNRNHNPDVIHISTKI